MEKYTHICIIPNQDTTQRIKHIHVQIFTFTMANMSCIQFQYKLTTGVVRVNFEIEYMTKLLILNLRWRFSFNLGIAEDCLVLSLLWCSLTLAPKSSHWSKTAEAKAYCKSLFNTLLWVPAGSCIPTGFQPRAEYWSALMAPTMVCIMFGFSGAV